MGKKFLLLRAGTGGEAQIIESSTDNYFGNLIMGNRNNGLQVRWAHLNQNYFKGLH